MDWLDLFAVQGILKSLAQHHSSKASVLWCSAFFMVQLWHPPWLLEKSITLNVQKFTGKGISLLFSMLSRFLTVPSPPTKEQVSFFSQLQPLSAADFGSQENKVCPRFHCFSMYVPWSIGTGCNYPCFLVSMYHIKAIHKKMIYKKAKWLSEEILQIRKKRSKSQREKKHIPCVCRVPKNIKNRFKKSRPKWLVQRNRGKKKNLKDQRSAQEN